MRKKYTPDGLSMGESTPVTAIRQSSVKNNPQVVYSTSFWSKFVQFCRKTNHSRSASSKWGANDESMAVSVTFDASDLLGTVSIGDRRRWRCWLSRWPLRLRIITGARLRNLVNNGTHIKTIHCEPVPGNIKHISCVLNSPHLFATFIAIRFHLARSLLQLCASLQKHPTNFAPYSSALTSHPWKSTVSSK